MSLFKYFGEQSARHRGSLMWSSVLDGLPVRGSAPPLLRQPELDEQLRVHRDFHFHEFDLRDPRDADYYHFVMDRILNQFFVLLHREHIKDPTSGRVCRVYLEWAQRYGEIAPRERGP